MRCAQSFSACAKSSCVVVFSMWHLGLRERSIFYFTMFCVKRREAAHNTALVATHNRFMQKAIPARRRVCHWFL
ncbi:hypothetical protein CKO_03868 [Citrobacter koseri ATCC BAA-895]|uniref:Uncharacterized protein n=1 Tax=Citrobacter koseri (strain ATCC BAA-895 / CDC 4225-83 / SGSC4696) TaxID=290338 RepID=A8AN80_CITK8|nr:hypothetical protein CKO_03868 [Citrobacter koseri ATCC BAA-895]